MSRRDQLREVDATSPIEATEISSAPAFFRISFARLTWSPV
jgi:hypothetical protein